MTVAGLPFVIRRSAVSGGGRRGCWAWATPAATPQITAKHGIRNRIVSARLLRAEELLRLGMGENRLQRVEAAGLIQFAGERADRVRDQQCDGRRGAGAADPERLQFRDGREAGAYAADIDRRV